MPEIVRSEIGELRPDPANTRRHPRWNIESIKGSLSRFGQQQPIIILPDGQIVAGNGTWQAARELGWKLIDTRVFTGAPADAPAFAIAANRTGELAEWDVDLLLDTLGQMPADLIEASGWDLDSLHRLMTPSGDPITPVEGTLTPDPGAPDTNTARWYVVIPCDSESDRDRVRAELEGMGYDLA